MTTLGMPTRARDAFVDGAYRYTLDRRWDAAAPPMVWIMLNPSTADAEQDDPTIRRCIGFAKREGCGGIQVVNLFALRVTRPVHLFDGTKGAPLGAENLAVVHRTLTVAGDHGYPVVCAWGAHPRVTSSPVYARVREHRKLWCVGRTKDGSPRHPLYVSYETPLEVWP